MSVANTSNLDRGLRFSKLTDVISDYANTTKPGIIVLLLISTACPMVLASGGSLDPALLCWTVLGGGLVSASACVLNCVYDRDIDAIMQRTKDRPIAAGRISVKSAIAFSIVLLFSGLWVLNTYANTYAALVSLFGHLFYVIAYTMYLKRSTPQNIVIGGAAGAVPPLVGWVAVTGELNWVAISLFLVIFFWTPPHFWALALNKNEDYKRANVPMLPVVAGELETHKQMLFYTLLLLPTSAWLVLMDENLGAFSLITLTFLNSYFVIKVIELFTARDKATSAARAWSTFGYSVFYLAMFFVCLLVDSTLV